MESIRTNSYGPPVNQLLTYGKAEGYRAPEKWPNYLELGLGSEQIPDLIRMATDDKLNWADSETLDIWAPVHAWRALGQLRAVEAIEPLFTLFKASDDNEWVVDDLPVVFGLIGPVALPALEAHLADVSSDEDARVSASACIEQIAVRWPEARPACVALLIKQLEQFTENGLDINAFLILKLVNLHVAEAAPLIERAFAADCVDLMLMGGWEEVQVELGFRTDEELEQYHAKKVSEIPFLTQMQQIMQHQSSAIELAQYQPLQLSSEVRRQPDASRQKSKRKMAKQSRKKNRKR
jgi:hypothetical protein